jgi:hypothetical protein
MAKVVNEFDFRVRKSRYPWAEWLDGQIWKLTNGTDFDCTPSAFGNAAYRYARRHGMTVRVCVDGDEVHLQCRKTKGETE